MNRPLRTRLAALAAAIVFLLSGAGDLLGAHPCAHHDAIGAQHAPAPADAESHAHHGAPAPAEHGAEPCSCAGTCSAGAGAVLPDSPVVSAPAAESVAPAPARPDERRLPVRLLPHLLPYAQAPPRAA